MFTNFSGNNLFFNYKYYTKMNEALILEIKNN